MLRDTGRRGGRAASGSRPTAATRSPEAGRKDATPRASSATAPLLRGREGTRPAPLGGEAAARLPGGPRPNAAKGPSGRGQRALPAPAAGLAGVLLTSSAHGEGPATGRSGSGARGASAARGLVSLTV